MELGVCEHLAEVSASENPEEHEAAALALSTLLKGTSTTVPAAPLVGSNAAAAVGRKVPAADVSASDTIPAGNFRAGGGIPNSTCATLLQLVAMHGVSDVGVDMQSTLHALWTATSEDTARKSIMQCALNPPALMPLNRALMLAIVYKHSKYLVFRPFQVILRSPTRHRSCVQDQ